MAETCRFPGCVRSASSGHRGLCGPCYERCKYHGTLEQFARPRDSRGRKSKAWHEAQRRATAMGLPADLLELPDYDEPKGDQVGAIARQIAALREATEIERARQRAEVLARLERAAARAAVA